jgi:6-phosphogluconate dehydrogenase
MPFSFTKPQVAVAFCLIVWILSAEIVYSPGRTFSVLTVKELYDVGIVGLGVMGRSLLFNLADHNVSVVGQDKDLERVKTVRKQSEGRRIRATDSLSELVGFLRVPRTVLLLVSTGQTIDRAVQDLLLHLTPSDAIVDCGDSYFKDTDRRVKFLAERGIHYLGIGISGGQYRARYGPGIMVGGPAEVYQRMRPFLEACAAQMDGAKPCVAYLGSGSSAHYVKMILDGIECGLMKLIAETYDLLKKGVKVPDDEIYAIYRDWNRGRFKAYLLEVTAHILSRADEASGQRLIDLILDEAEQSETGVWAVKEALRLQVPVPTINTAVNMRILSACKKERIVSSRIFTEPTFTFHGEREYFIKEVRNALFAGTIMAWLSFERHRGPTIITSISRRLLEYGAGDRPLAGPFSRTFSLLTSRSRTLRTRC